MLSNRLIYASAEASFKKKTNSCRPETPAVLYRRTAHYDIFSLAHEVFGSLARWHRYRKVAAELSALDGHLLCDIGLNRSRIEVETHNVADNADARDDAGDDAGERIQ